MCEIGPNRALVITDEIPGDLSRCSCLPQLVCSPRVGRRSPHADMDDLPRAQFKDEKREERPKEEIGDLEKIAGPDLSPDLSPMIAQKRPQVLPRWPKRTHTPHVPACPSESFVCRRDYPV